MAQAVEERFGGEVPIGARRPRDAAGRRAQDRQRRALGVVYELPGLPVDTHVTRLVAPAEAHERDRSGEDRARSRRRWSPPEEWGGLSLRLIEHGRQVCDRPQAALRRVRARRHLPVGRQGRAQGPQAHPAAASEAGPHLITQARWRRAAYVISSRRPAARSRTGGRRAAPVRSRTARWRRAESGVAP